MKIIKPKKALFLITVATLFYGSQVLATNGMIPHGAGAKNKAMAGAGVALSQDAMSVATNPASGVGVGDKLEMGLAIFSPFREATEYNTTNNGNAGDGFTLPGTYKSDSNAFPVPYIAKNWTLNKSSAFTLAIYAAGGMNTDYPSAPWNGAPPGTSTGIDLKQLIIAPTYSWKASENTSIGVSALIGLQWFEARGLTAFATHTVDGTSNNLTDNGHDFAYGAGLKLGIQHKLNDKVTLGAAFATEVNMTKFDDYSQLFAEGGDLDMPANITIGLAWKTSPRSVLAFDVQKIFYSKVAAIGNSIRNLSGCPSIGGSNPRSQSCFGGSDGPGFGWDDMTIYKLGYQWQSSKTMTWRVGVSHGKNPVSETTLNILAPAVVETHYTFGLTKNIDKKSDITLAMMYAPEKSVRARSAVGFQDDVEIKMYQFEIELAWSKRF